MLMPVRRLGCHRHAAHRVLALHTCCGLILREVPVLAIFRCLRGVLGLVMFVFFHDSCLSGPAERRPIRCDLDPSPYLGLFFRIRRWSPRTVLPVLNFFLSRHSRYPTNAAITSAATAPATSALVSVSCEAFGKFLNTCDIKTSLNPPMHSLGGFIATYFAG